MLDTTATADQILAIPLSKPHLLFPGDKEQASRLHKRLAALWHPDRNKGAPSAVLGHINVLFNLTIEALDKGTWAGGAVLRLVAKDNGGTVYELRYQKLREFELGKCYIAAKYVLYVLEPKFKDLATNAVTRIRALRYKTAPMEAEHKRYMPEIAKAFTTTGDNPVVLMHKNPTQLCLADVQEYLGGTVPQAHVCWILSSLYNLNCYLKWAGITHNDISPANYFIDAAAHNGRLIGGWWYAGLEGHKPPAVPHRTHRSAKDFTTKAVDGSLIRLTGQELMGIGMMKAPAPFQRWLRGLGNKDSFIEYRNWSECLTASFGPRRYAELKLPASLY